MRFRSVGVFLLALLAASCGKLSDKAPSDKTLLPGGDIGCFDQLGDRVSRYFSGQIGEDEWNSTFDCVKDQITFFRKYVKGAVPDGYVPADIASLIRKFLITNRPISDQFVNSLFELKASAFGGQTAVITFSDFDEFLRLNETLRKESLALLPALKARKALPNGDNLLKLADAVDLFGSHLSKYLAGLKGSADVSKDSFLPFARELITINGGDGTLVDRYGDFVRSLKPVITGGSRDVIEKGSWATLVREGASFGGLLLAYRDMQDHPFANEADQDAFMVELVKRGRVAANRVISSHGVGISLDVFDPVIDTVPWDELTPDRRDAIKKDLRQIVYHGLQSKAQGYLTTAALGNALGLYLAGMGSQVHIKRIYQNLPENPSPKDFEVAARKYMAGISKDRRPEVDQVIEVAKSFVGLFPEGSSQMLFTNAMRETRTRNHMLRMTWYRHIILYLFSVYATGPQTAPGERAALASDLESLENDFLEILQQWKLADPKQTTAEMAAKRFREANLFMPVSDGDTMVNDVEATYYIAFLISSSGLSGRIFNTITEDWRACPIEGKDPLGSDAMNAECFRKFYFGHPEVFWSEFPGLQVAYAKMSDEDKASLKYSMEVASRQGGYSQDPIGPYDIDSFAALPHYVEDIMERFDVNNDEKLDRDEILNRAFPIFKETLSVYSTNEGIEKAILTYIIHYGKAPSSTTAVLLWWVKMKFAKIEATRIDLYRVVAVLSESPPKSTDSKDASDVKGKAFAALDAVSSH